jgi:carboxypeptidase C (cathepsin A)
MNDYLSRELDWKGHHPYRILTGKVQPWRWDAENQIVNLSARLQNALVTNPDLRVLVMCGYTDLATPPANMQFSIDHLMNIPTARREAIKTVWYEAGHMFYLNQPDLQKMRKDLVDFIH